MDVNLSHVLADLRKELDVILRKRVRCLVTGLPAGTGSQFESHQLGEST